MTQKYNVKRINVNTILFNGTRVKGSASSSRVVFFCGDVVVKFDTQREKGNPYADSSINFQCKREYRAWLKLKKTSWKDYFAPVLQKGISDGYHYVVMQFVEIEDNNSSSRPVWAETIISTIERRVGICDLHWGNWTATGGKVTIFDYALGNVRPDIE